MAVAIGRRGGASRRATPRRATAGAGRGLADVDGVRRALVMIGWLVVTPTHQANQRVPIESFSGFFRGLGFIRSPMNPISAGSIVSAISTASATARAAKMPMIVRNGMFATLSPSSAMKTVRPAKTTAEPAVPTARPVASSRSEPLRSSSR